MNSKLPYILFAVTLLGAVSTTAIADKRNQAVTACKSHIEALYKDDLQKTKLKKTYQRSKYVEVKMKVMTTNDTFKAVCKITSSGELTYSTDQDTE